MKKKQLIVNVPVKAEIREYKTGERYIQFMDDDFAKLFFYEQITPELNIEECFRENLIMFNEINEEQIDFYQKRSIYFKKFDKVFLFVIYGIGLHFVFNLNKKATKVKGSIDIFGTRIFFINHWRKVKSIKQ